MKIDEATRRRIVKKFNSSRRSVPGSPYACCVRCGRRTKIARMLDAWRLLDERPWLIADSEFCATHGPSPRKKIAEWEMKHRPADILCHRDGVTYFLRFEDTELGALAKEVAEKALDTGRHRWLNDDTLSLDASAYQAVDEALDIVKRLKRKEVR